MHAAFCGTYHAPVPLACSGHEHTAHTWLHTLTHTLHTHNRKRTADNIHRRRMVEMWRAAAHTFKCTHTVHLTTS